MNLKDYFSQYTSELSACLKKAVITDKSGVRRDTMPALLEVIGKFRQAHANGGKIIFVGNGGSAAMASHQAFDYWKNGKMRATALNDSVLLTGGGNDFGYPRVFSESLKMFATENDVVVAISSSGKSENILNASIVAKEIGCFVFTMSAFGADNPLRKLGDVNLYLETMIYGHAEIGHETFLHTMLDYTIFGEKAPDPFSSLRKIVTPQEMAEIAKMARLSGKKVVHAHGVFDLVHPGHINYFQQSKKLGDILYVGVVADRFVKKGPDRPRFPERMRLEWLAALETVDYVVLNEEDGPWTLIENIKPDFYTKGETEKAKLDDPFSGLNKDKQKIEAIGGQLVFTPEVRIHSTDLMQQLGME